jgi:hypothetical protein
VKGKLNEIKYRQKRYADKHTVHREQLNPNDKVVVQTGPRQWIPATIVEQANAPRSYNIQKQLDGKIIRRNSQHIVKTSATMATEVSPRPDYSRNDDLQHRITFNNNTADGNSQSENIYRNIPVRDNTSDHPVNPVETNASTPPILPYTTRSGRTVRQPIKLDL